MQIGYVKKNNLYGCRLTKIGLPRAYLNMGDYMKKTTLLALLALTGCATPITMQAVGGSKADGTVDLGFEYGAFQNPIVDREAALETARQRCKAWGYKNAEAFGGTKNQCVAFNGYGNCMRQTVTVTFQCLDK